MRRVAGLGRVVFIRDGGTRTLGALGEARLADVVIARAFDCQCLQEVYNVYAKKDGRQSGGVTQLEAIFMLADMGLLEHINVSHVVHSVVEGTNRSLRPRNTIHMNKHDIKNSGQWEAGVEYLQ